METVYRDKSRCCGCGACRSLCGAGAVEMRADEEGFLYPVIDQEKCVNCGRCRLACPFEKEDHYQNQGGSKFYAAKHRSQEVLRRSASGGAFTALSDAVLAEEGVVYGADFDGEFRVRHARAETEEQRDRMRISKYAQSHMGTMFIRAAEDLKAGRRVLFTGTPCQLAGLKAFLGSGRGGGSELPENLYLCDLICHSVPSPLVWADLVSLLEEEYGGRLAEVEFRTKDLPWNRVNSKKTFTFRLEGCGRTYVDNRFYELYFGRMTIMRPSCENCPFCSPRRTGDVTIADYWGVEKYAPELDDPLGVSLVLSNTEKGRELLEKCRADLTLQERPSSEAMTEQGRLSTPVSYPEDRAEFWETYRRDGLAATLKI